MIVFDYFPVKNVTQYVWVRKYRPKRNENEKRY